jgi:hypothetical protein
MNNMPNIFTKLKRTIPIPYVYFVTPRHKEYSLCAPM